MNQNLVTTDDPVPDTIETVAADMIVDKNLDDFVTFKVGGQLFGIPILMVQDILRLEDIALIPLAPSKVRGSINLRGAIVTVISVRNCLGLGERENEHGEGHDDTDMGVTIEQGGNLYTLLVDSIGDVVNISPKSFESTPSTMDAKWRNFSKGVYRLDSELMVVLDVERVLVGTPSD